MASRVIPLAMTSSGELVQVVDIKPGCGLVRRLADMGLTPGVTIKVINSHKPGPVIIELRGSKLVLGQGVSNKIMVTIA